VAHSGSAGNAAVSLVVLQRPLVFCSKASSSGHVGLRHQKKADAGQLYTEFAFVGTTLASMSSRQYYADCVEWKL
jgi:hypothetical protein